MFLSTNVFSQKSKILKIESYAVHMFKKKQYDKIVSDIEPLLNDKNYSNKLYRILGYSKIQLKDYRGGINILDQNIKKKDYFDNLYLSKSYQGLGNDSVAIYYLKIAAPFDKKYKVFDHIYDIYISQKQYIDAANTILEKIKLKQKHRKIITSNDYFKSATDLYMAATKINQRDTIKLNSIALKSDSLFLKAISIKDKLPTYYLSRARVNRLIINKENKWLGVPLYEKFLTNALKFKSKNSTGYKVDNLELFEAYKYIGEYYKSYKLDINKSKIYFLQAVKIKIDDSEVNANLLEGF